MLLMSSISSPAPDCSSSPMVSHNTNGNGFPPRPSFTGYVRNYQQTRESLQEKFLRLKRDFCGKHESCWICTCVVTLVPANPEMALLVTWPVKMELMELKKLDFPAPTGPIIKIRARLTDVTRGLYFLIISMSSSLRLRNHNFII